MCMWSWKIRKPGKGKTVAGLESGGGFANPRKPSSKAHIAEPAVAGRREEVKRPEVSNGYQLQDINKVETPPDMILPVPKSDENSVITVRAEVPKTFENHQGAPQNNFRIPKVIRQNEHKSGLPAEKINISNDVPKSESPVTDSIAQFEDSISPPLTSGGINSPPTHIPITNPVGAQAVETSEFEPAKLARKGTIREDVTANVMKILLADIDRKARGGLEEAELIILQTASDKIGWSMPAEQKVTDLVSTLETWRDNLEKKRGRLINFPWCGKTLNVTTLLDDAVGWIRRFREIGDVVVQCDPIHLGLPWAGIKFMTQIFVEDRDNIGAISITLERVTNVTALSTAYVALLSQSDSMDDTIGLQLKTCLVTLHKIILSFLASAIKYLQNHKKEAVRSLLKIDNFGESLEGINNCMGRVHQLGQVIGAKDASKHRLWEKDQFQKLVEGLGKSLKFTESLAKDLKEQKKHELLNWISKTPYIKHHKDAGQGMLEHTGKWLFDTRDEFHIWKEPRSNVRIFWLNGNPGVGKTYLTHAAIEWQRQYSLVIYFYCSMRDNDNSRGKPASIMSSLLRALIVESGINPETDFLELHRRYQSRAEDGELSMDETCSLISQLLARFQQPRIFIDALDEVDKADRFILLKHLFELIKQTTLKVWVSSRVEDDIKLMMSKDRRGEEEVSAVHVGNNNMEDIALYVDREVHAAIEDARLLCGVVDDGLKNLIIQKLTEKSEGMFLWVRLQVLNICNARLSQHVHDQLERLPKGLSSTYDTIYQMINNEISGSVEHAKHALRWVICAERPLTLTEWIGLVKLSSKDASLESANANYLQNICHNLVDLDRDSGTIRFVHLSVREYLSQLPDLNSTQPHEMAARACLQHLVETETAEKLLPYVVQNWPIHYKRSMETSPAGSIESLVLNFFVNKGSHKRWLSRVATDDLDAESSLNPLFTVARYGIQDICRVILHNPQEYDVDLAHRNSKQRTPLHLAIKFGHLGVFKELLEYGEGLCEINVRDEDGRTPFALAVFLQASDFVNLLISNKEVDFNTPDSPALGAYPPLVRATWQENILMVKVLLEACKPRLNIDAVNGRGETALHWAVIRSSEHIVQLLLDSGTNVNVRSDDCQVPLAVVVENKYDLDKEENRKIFSLLCAHPEMDFHTRDEVGVDIPCRFLSSWERLMSEYEDLDVSHLSAMLGEIVGAKNCNVNAPGHPTGLNLLQLCAADGIVGAVHVLLKVWDIDVNLISGTHFGSGRGALHIALIEDTPQCDKVAEALIAFESVDIGATDDFGTTPLTHVVEFKKWRLAKLMLRKAGVGDDMLKDIENNQAFAEKCKKPNNHHGALAVLGVKEPQAVVSSINHISLERQRLRQLVEDVVDAAILSDPAEAKKRLQQLDVNIRGPDQGTPLMYLAAQTRYTSGEKLRGFRALLDIEGIQINTKDILNFTVLDWVVALTELELVEMLLARPELEITIQSTYGHPLLIRAIVTSDTRIVTALAKDPRIDVNVVDLVGNSACIWAIRGAPVTADLFTALLNSNRLDINCKSRSLFETPLFTASSLNAQGIVRLLLDRSDLTTLDEPNSNWDTPLGIAVRGGHFNIVKMLLEKGANLYWKNYKGQTPLDIAIEKGNAEMVELIGAAMI